MKVDYDPCTDRWFICLPEEPGRPRIEADDRETLLAFLEEHVQREVRQRGKKQLSQAGA